MASPRDAFGETLGDGRGPCHDLGFPLFGCRCFDEPRQHDTALPTLQPVELCSGPSLDVGQKELEHGATPDDPDGNEMDN
jgi:hypothetical protein